MPPIAQIKRLEATHFLELVYTKEHFRKEYSIRGEALPQPICDIKSLNECLEGTKRCGSLFTGFIWKIKFKQS